MIFFVNKKSVKVYSKNSKSLLEFESLKNKNNIEIVDKKIN